MHNRYIKYIFNTLTLAALMLIPFNKSAGSNWYTHQDTLLVKQDSIPLLKTDSLTVASDSTTFNKDSIERAGTLELPVFSQARDSIVEDWDGKKMIYYYGDVSVKYKDISISSEYMAYDVDSKTVFAKGLKDTSGNIIGSPVMTQGNSSYEMESVYYNFESQKAKIRNMTLKADNKIELDPEDKLIFNLTPGFSAANFVLDFKNEEINLSLKFD